jgi:hypothetical protein
MNHKNPLEIPKPPKVSIRSASSLISSLALRKDKAIVFKVNIKKLNKKKLFAYK